MNGFNRTIVTYPVAPSALHFGAKFLVHFQEEITRAYQRKLGGWVDLSCTAEGYPKANESGGSTKHSVLKEFIEITSQ